jgi:polysaccharide biosynthesis protein PslH
MSLGDLRVLLIVSMFPFPPRSGFETRCYHLLRQIARRHDVTLLTYATRDELADVERLRQEFTVEVVPHEAVSRYTKRRRQAASLASTVPFAARSVQTTDMQQAIDRLCARPYDVVQLESILLWRYRFPMQSRVVLDEHNVEYEVFARMRAVETSPLRKTFYRLEERRIRAFEQSAWRRVSGCVVTSRREEHIVHEHAPDTPTAVVPNAVDLDYFRTSGLAVVPKSIVFNGVLDYRPNVDAANFLVDEILPLVRGRCPEVQLTIVGRGAPAELERLRRHGVQVTGEVADLRPHLERAAVLVVPIRMGGGTRLKVVEGLAMTKALVSTTLGCEGIDVQDGEHLLIADTATDFAAQIVRLFDDPTLAEKLGRNGRGLIERAYSWDAAGERLAELYQRVAQ